MLWSAWHPYVLPEVPGVPLPVLDHYIRQTAISFFAESQVWTASLAPIPVVASTGTYALVAAAETITAAPLLTEVPEVSQVKWVWVDGQQIFPSSQEELGALLTQWDDVEAAMVSNYTQITQDTITLYPIPNFSSATGLVVKVALRPTLTAVGVPDWLGAGYVQEIAAGAKSALMGMVGRSWSNAAGEEKYGASYASGLTKATVEGQRSFTRTTQTVKFLRFG